MQNETDQIYQLQEMLSEGKTDSYDNFSTPSTDKQKVQIGQMEDEENEEKIVYANDRKNRVMNFGKNTVKT